jgi:hypothetical protein
MAWNEVLRFVLLISVWFLQHSFIALSLANEYHITPRELSAIRSRSPSSLPHPPSSLLTAVASRDMTRISPETSQPLICGICCRCPVPLVTPPHLVSAQDMGENYSDKETDLLLEMIDSDGLGVVEFPELVRWWCDESGGEESLGAAASSGEE